MTSVYDQLPWPAVELECAKRFKHRSIASCRVAAPIAELAFTICHSETPNHDAIFALSLAGARVGRRGDPKFATVSAATPAAQTVAQRRVPSKHLATARGRIGKVSADAPA